MRRITHIGIASLLLVCAAPTVWAQQRKNPLEGQPAIRHRHELRDKRFEFGPSIMFSLNRDLRHAFLFGLKAEFYITDYLSIGADVGFGVGLDTGLAGEIEQRCTPSCTSPLAGRGAEDEKWEDRKGRFSDIKFAGDVRLAFTPFSGKMGIFSRLFVAYDFYVFGGFGFALIGNNSNVPGVDQANEGFRPGAVWGVGMHLFFTKWFAMSFEFKDLMYADNESGSDITRGLTDTEVAQGKILVDGDDKKFTHHFFAGIKFTFYAPFSIKISN